MMQHGILRWVEGERGGWGGPQHGLCCGCEVRVCWWKVDGGECH